MFLERECETFERELPRLLSDGFAGQYALVKGDVVLGVYPALQEAVESGYALCGVEEFLARHIGPRKPTRCDRAAAGLLAEENERLRQRVVKLQEALRPLARIAEAIDEACSEEDGPRDHLLVSTATFWDVYIQPITVGHCRKAQEVLDAKS